MKYITHLNTFRQVFLVQYKLSEMGMKVKRIRKSARATLTGNIITKVTVLGGYHKNMLIIGISTYVVLYGTRRRPEYNAVVHV